MRHGRRGGRGGHEFGASGEDSFVAVVVTKLTGALLFILLLTMVIMALIPKGTDAPASARDRPPVVLAIRTPPTLPEAIAGRPYALALSAVGGGAMRWSVEGPLPEGLSLDAEAGVIAGTPKAGTPEPATLQLRVADGESRATSVTQLTVYQPDRPLSLPQKYLPGLPPIAWRAWVEQGFGFVVLALAHLAAMGAVGGLERASGGPSRRFSAYRLAVRLASLGAMAGLGLWLSRARG